MLEVQQPGVYSHSYDDSNIKILTVTVTSRLLKSFTSF